MNNYKKGLCSICCLGYNNAPFIENSLKSIWNQEYKNIEIILLDDGSSDNSLEILDDLKNASKFPMTIIKSKHTGNVAASQNMMIDKAEGEFISFLSLDDCLEPSALSEKINLMLKDEKIAFIANSKIKAINERGEETQGIVPPLKLNEIKTITVDTLLETEYNEAGSFYVQGSVFRKNIIDRINGYDEDMLGDEIVLRTKVFLFLKANPDYKFRILRNSSCLYRMHSNNLSKNVIRQIQLFCQYLKRYWPDRKVPQIIYKWAVYGAGRYKIEEYIKAFTFNDISIKMLEDKNLQKAIKKMIINDYIKKSPFRKFFTYEFIGSNHIKLTVLSLFKLTFKAEIGRL